MRTMTPASPTSTCGCMRQVLQVGHGVEAHRAQRPQSHKCHTRASGTDPATAQVTQPPRGTCSHHRYPSLRTTSSRGRYEGADAPQARDDPSPARVPHSDANARLPFPYPFVDPLSPVGPPGFLVLVGKSGALEVSCLSSNLGSTTSCLCDFGQVTQLLYASASLSVRCGIIEPIL